jgi:hypothetical protein
MVEIPLEESIWAPSRRSCNKDNSLLANIPAHNVPGKTEEERVKFIKWSLKDNEHVKNIKETFKRGNVWIEVDFDCEFGRNEAIQKISKKESDWYRMIPEEDKERRKTEQKTYNNEYQNRKDKTTEHKKKSHRKEEIQEKEENTDSEEEEARNTKHITIWDLPADINKKELEYICRRFKNAQITEVKRSKYKALAIIQVEESGKRSTPWSIPVDNHKLIRVTEGKKITKQDKNKGSIQQN